MPVDPHAESKNPQDLLDEAISEFLSALDAGRAPDRSELLDRFSRVADDLEAFFADHDRLRSLADPLRPPSLLEPCSMASAEHWGAGVSSAAVAPTLWRPVAQIAAQASGERPANESRPGAPQFFGAYELLAEVARGGMGVVYKARHLKLNRIVALKMILAGQLASREEVRRFYAEAAAAAKLDHVGIVPVYEVAEHQGQHYFAMGFVEGESLAELIARGPLPPFAAAELLKKISESVAYAHSKGVIHRDLKPANVLLQMKPEGRETSDSSSSNKAAGLSSITPKITDFGLATRSDGGHSLTATGQILGTPSYMPPEQAAGKMEEINETADIYALGAILYAMLTGRPPFIAESPLDILAQVLESEPTLPHKLCPGIPRSLEWICLKCLEKSPEQRYASAGELAADLERFLRQEPVEARPANWWHRLRRWARREPALASHALAVSLLFLIAQIRFAQDPQDWPYHLRVSGLLTVWGLSAVVFQQFLNRERWSEITRYLWSATDLLLLTLLLALLAKPLGPLLVGYPLLVAASGLFFRVRLVALTTLLAIIGYLALWYWSDNTPPPHYAVVLVATLAVLGFVVGYQVRRVRVLSQYYEHRNLP